MKKILDSSTPGTQVVVRIGSNPVRFAAFGLASTCQVQFLEVVYKTTAPGIENTPCGCALPKMPDAEIEVERPYRIGCCGQVLLTSNRTDVVLDRPGYVRVQLAGTCSGVSVYAQEMPSGYSVIPEEKGCCGSGSSSAPPLCDQLQALPPITTVSGIAIVSINSGTQCGLVTPSDIAPEIPQTVNGSGFAQTIGEYIFQGSSGNDLQVTHIPDCSETPFDHATLLSLRNSGALRTKCHYRMSGFSQGNVPAGTELFLHATSPSSFASWVGVLLPGQTSAWFGLYDMDNNLLTELHDNLGNVAKGITGVEVATFPWLNPQFNNVFVEQATLLVDSLTSGPKINIKITGGAFVDMRGCTGPVTEVDITANSSVTLNQAAATLRNVSISGATVDFTGADGSCFVVNTQVTGGSTVLALNVADLTVSACTVSDNSLVEVAPSPGQAVTIEATNIRDFSMVYRRVNGAALSVSKCDISGQSVVQVRENSTAPLTIVESTLNQGIAIINPSTIGDGVTIQQSTIANSGIVRKQSNVSGGEVVVYRSNVHSGTVVSLNAQRRLLVDHSSVIGLSVLRQVGSAAGSDSVSRSTLTDQSFVVFDVYGISADGSTRGANLKDSIIEVSGAHQLGYEIVACQMDSSVLVLRNNSALPYIARLSASSGSQITVQDNIAARDVIRTRVDNYGTLTVEQCSVAGRTESCHIHSGGSIIVSDQAGNGYEMVAYAGGTIRHNGGNQQQIVVAFDELTTGNFNHINVVWESDTPQTLTAPNSNQARHLALAVSAYVPGGQTV